MLLSNIKGKHSLLYAIGTITLLVLIGIVVGNSFPWYSVTRISAIDQLKEIQSNYIGLLGIGFAIFAILLAIIQLAYKQLSIIKILIEESYFQPVFCYGMFNILLCAILYSFQYSGRPFSDNIYIRLIIIEGYLFWVLVPFLLFVSFKIIRLTNFSYISELYLQRLLRMVNIEKKGGTTDKFRQSIQNYGEELRSETIMLIGQNKVIQLNKVFDFYIKVLRTNHTSNLLENIPTSMKNWFIQSYKLPETDIFQELITTWWNFYAECLSLGFSDKVRYLSTIPLNLYNQFRKSKDEDIKHIAIQIFPIRLKEFAWMRIYQMLNERSNFDFHYDKIVTSLSIFPDLIKATIDENDIDSLDVMLTQLRLILQLLETEHLELENKRLGEPHAFTTNDAQVQNEIKRLMGYVYSIRMTAYGWIMYKIFEHE